jgi:hypothetical protein
MSLDLAAVEEIMFSFAGYSFAGPKSETLGVKFSSRIML